MTKVSFIVPARNKAKYIEATVRTVLAQTYSPMEIVLSDQGSTDGTLEILQRMAAEYKGPNEVRVLQCPLVDYKGMAGLNNHLNWLHTQITGELVIMCSADDFNHPDRAKYTVEAYEKFHPSYIGTCVEYLENDLSSNGEITANNHLGDRWISPIENINDLVGSSASSCWARDLYDKYGPLQGVESQDISLPFFGTLERGLYYVAKPLHAYVRRADPDNTGLEGVVRAAANKEEEHALVEMCNYHYSSIFMQLLRRSQQLQINLTQEVLDALVNKLIYALNIWTISRDNITMLKIEPKGMKV